MSERRGKAVVMRFLRYSLERGRMICVVTLGEAGRM